VVDLLNLKPTYSAIWFGRKRELEVLNIVKVHFECIVSTVSALRDLVYAVCDGNFDEADRIFKIIFQRERDADDVKEKILDELSKGPFHPADKEEIMHLILTADDIASNAKSAGRKFCMARGAILPKDIGDGLRVLADLSFQITSKLKDAFEVLVRDPRKAVDVAEEVERLEEKIDDHRVGLIMMILSWGENYPKISRWIMIKEAVENIEAAADKCEDTADVIRMISISRV
jgi:predicted phosphate transport protein (TIGR00153 family)